MPPEGLFGLFFVGGGGGRLERGVLSRSTAVRVSRLLGFSACGFFAGWVPTLFGGLGFTFLLLEMSRRGCVAAQRRCLISIGNSCCVFFCDASAEREQTEFCREPFFLCDVGLARAG